MKKMSLLVTIVCVTLAGCSPANITASKWDSGLNGPTLQTRCEEVDLRSNSDMETVFRKYDGWKLVYVSEYTTGHKIGTSAAVCFERARQ